MTADGHTIEVISMPGPDGVWLRRVSVLGVAGCTVDSHDADVTDGVERVLTLLGERLADGVTADRGAVRPLRPDLDLVTRLYQTGGV